MAGTLKKISGPAYIAAAAADIYTPPASTIDTIIRHIHIANVTALQATFTLYVGATGGSAGGTELAKSVSVPANDFRDLYFSPGLRLSSAQFLSGLASTASTLAITVMGEQVVN